MLKECEIEPEIIEQTDIKQKGPRTTNNWYGDNEYIPLKYLTPTSSCSSVEENIKNIPFCAHLLDEQIKELIENGKTESIETETVICSEGEIADKVYLILEGKVKVYKKDNMGNEIQIAIIDQGNMFGEMALFDKGLRSAYVKTIEPCKFLIFGGDKFLDVLMG